MANNNTNHVDEYSIRCPRLGHNINFSYCRNENSGLPCFKTLDCWFQHFPVEEYLKKKLSKEEWEKIFERKGPTKVQSLLELIGEAKKRTEK